MKKVTLTLASLAFVSTSLFAQPQHGVEIKQQTLAKPVKTQQGTVSKSGHKGYTRIQQNLDAGAVFKDKQRNMVNRLLMRQAKISQSLSCVMLAKTSCELTLCKDSVRNNHRVNVQASPHNIQRWSQGSNAGHPARQMKALQNRSIKATAPYIRPTQK